MDIKIRIIFKIYDTKIRIYILYNYELYKLIIKIYVHKYVSKNIWTRKMFFIAGSKRFVPYFPNHNKNLYNKFKF